MNIKQMNIGWKIQTNLPENKALALERETLIVEK
jgi:hypothetical protein